MIKKSGLCVYLIILRQIMKDIIMYIEAFQETTRKWPNKITLDYTNTKISFGELLRTVNKKLDILKNRIEHGARVRY